MIHEYESWNGNNAPLSDPRRVCDHPGCGQTRAEHTGLLPLEREVPMKRQRSIEYRNEVVAIVLIFGINLGYPLLWLLFGGKLTW